MSKELCKWIKWSGVSVTNSHLSVLRDQKYIPTLPPTGCPYNQCQLPPHIITEFPITKLWSQPEWPRAKMEFYQLTKQSPFHSSSLLLHSSWMWLPQDTYHLNTTTIFVLVFPTHLLSKSSHSFLPLYPQPIVVCHDSNQFTGINLHNHLPQDHHQTQTLLLCWSSSPPHGLEYHCLPPSLNLHNYHCSPCPHMQSPGPSSGIPEHQLRSQFHEAEEMSPNSHQVQICHH